MVEIGDKRTSDYRWRTREITASNAGRGFKLSRGSLRFFCTCWQLSLYTAEFFSAVMTYRRNLAWSDPLDLTDRKSLKTAKYDDNDKK